MNIDSLGGEPFLADITRGELLRRWRESVMKLSGAQLAQRLPVARSAISQWETGQRSIDRDTVSRIASASGAPGACLEQMMFAAGTPAGFDAETRWEHNFPAGSGPVFCWVRSSDGASPVDVHIRWGILEADLRLPAAGRGPLGGQLLLGPVGVANPRLVVDLRPAGWVDFMVGAPPRQLGLQTISIVPRLRGARRTTPWAFLWAKHLVRRMQGRTAEFADFVGMDEAFVQEMAGHSDRSLSSEDVNTTDSAPRVLASPGGEASIRRARVARGLSQQALASAVADLTGSTTSQDLISRVERGVGAGGGLTLAAVDRVLGADGRTCAVQYQRSESGSMVVRFPPWWVGPIWVEVDRQCTVVMTWRPYTKRVRVPADLAPLYLRCADPRSSMHIATSPPSSVDVGLGRRANSVDVNEGWLPTSAGDLRDLLAEGEELGLRIFRRSRVAAARLVRRR